jgi:hypothetical protein
MKGPRRTSWMKMAYAQCKNMFSRDRLFYCKYAAFPSQGQSWNCRNQVYAEPQIVAYGGFSSIETN